MNRFRFLGHGFFLALILVLPLLRGAWDQWIQTSVLLAWTFWVALAALLIWRRGLSLERCETAVRRWGPLWAGLLGMSCLSAFQSDYPHSAWPGFFNDLTLAGFFFLGAGLGPERRSLYFRALAGAGLLAALAALVRDGLLRPAVGVSVNANVLAAGVILLWPVAWSIGAESAERGPRQFWRVAAGVMAAVGVLTRSVSAAAVLLMQAMLLAGRSFRGSGKKMWAVMGLGGLGAAWVLALHGHRVLKLAGDPDRWSWWRTAWAMALAHPLWGTGPGSFGEAFPGFRTDPWGLNSLYAHNAVLELIAERGFLGGGLFLIWIARVLLRGKTFESLRKSFPTAGTQWNSDLWGVGLLGFSLYNLGHIAFSFPALAWLFALCGGLGVSPMTLDPPFSRKTRLRLSLGLTGVLVVASVFSFRLFRGGQFLERGRWAFQRGNLESARASADRGIRWDPRSPELYSLRAALRLRADDRTGAADDLSMAVRLSPASAGFRMDRAELSLLQGDLASALEDYKAVNRLLPLKYAAWERRGDLLSKGGRLAEAAAAYEGALRALESPLVLSGREDERRESVGRINEKRGRVQRHATG